MEINISALPKNVRAYYHIRNDLENYIKDNEELITVMKEDQFSESDILVVEGENDGLKIALNLVTQAISSLELRDVKNGK
jgi:hypothetical protein